MIRSKKKIIAVVGMGYVGLPLIIELSKFYTCFGYDVDKKKISNLKKSLDLTNEVKTKNFAKNICFTHSAKNLNKANIVILCIPTPIYKNKKPDLSLLKKATITVSKYLSKKTIIVYESTVYPGVTEEICAPLIEKSSKLIWKRDFHVGYSPERINPGDKIYNLKNTFKIVSGDTEETLNALAKIYGKITKVHLAESIKVAEAAKVIENAQRDINIAFINEISIIFSKLGINPHNVLKAASTKWNFLDFSPGLVGGHCIGIDPYYLAYKAQLVKIKPKIILAGREINEQMSSFLLKRLIKIIKPSSKILFMGVSFKENCSDLRNSKNLILAKMLERKKFNLTICDDLISKNDIKKYHLNKNYLKFSKLCLYNYDAVVFPYVHDHIKNIPLVKIKSLLNKNAIVFDLKNFFKKEDFEKDNFRYYNF